MSEYGPEYTVVFSDYPEPGLSIANANDLMCVYGDVHHCFLRVEMHVNGIWWRPYMQGRGR